MLQLKILFRNAFHNKLRSGLTILGITAAVPAFCPWSNATLTGDSTYAIM
jgi:hypothetical protein